MSIETFKPASSEIPLRTCGNCMHSYSERAQGQLQPMLVCHRFPPGVLLLPVAAPPSNRLQVPGQAPPPTYQVASMFPPVQPHQFCHSHTPKPVGDEPVIVDEPAANG